jgi:hypothetical protein
MGSEVKVPHTLTASALDRGEWSASYSVQSHLDGKLDALLFNTYQLYHKVMYAVLCTFFGPSIDHVVRLETQPSEYSGF